MVGTTVSGMELRELADRIEYVSAGYADHYRVERTPEWALLKLTEELGELTQAHLTLTGQGRARGLTPDEQRRTLALEVGDVIGMAIVYANLACIDVEKAVTDKWLQYESFHRERGFTAAEKRRETIEG